MATNKDVDFYDEEEPEITQNLAFLQRILQQNALQQQQSSIHSNRTETTTIDTGEIREQIYIHFFITVADFDLWLNFSLFDCSQNKNGAKAPQ